MTILNIMGNVLPPTISAKTIAFIPEPPISVPVLTRPGATESSMRTITTLHCSFDDISEPRCRWTPNPRSFQRDMFVKQGANYIGKNINLFIYAVSTPDSTPILHTSLITQQLNIQIPVITILHNFML
ncbi:hypothetical protein M8J76_013346 [Diaphorina citri]|nr:hypothetical protein M8J75_013204 [Diaphorina citri]KAI5733646.1 hypothetical protein M8J76_014178 [Diaphorina citri]KAI5750167.1 hypothetical protein M8J76_013346 [Diaphorina citri]